MKLDATDLRYITPDEFRVLKGVEQGSRAHHVIPSSSIAQLSGLHHSGLNRLLASLAKRNLIAREQNIKYDGYRLTYGGYDFLAVRAMKEKDHVAAVGHRIGVGKESDIYLVSAPEPDFENRILKIHRLGRVSFRAVKEKRDYTNKNSQRQNYSWMYLSRLAAAKEYLFMQVLHRHRFPVPKPIAQSRHTVLMSLIDAYPLRQIAELPSDQIPLLYSALMALIVRLAKAGLIHGDFNEFNLLIKEKGDEDTEDEEAANSRQPSTKESSTTAHDSSNGDEESLQIQPGEKVERGNGFERVIATHSEAPPIRADGGEEASDTDSDDDSISGSDRDDEDAEEPIHLADGSTVEPVLIDFPQMISVMHVNAKFFFDRDVACVRRFFKKRFRYISEDFPRFEEVVESSDSWQIARAQRERARNTESSATINAANAGDEVIRDESEFDDGYLDLDVLTKASGYIKTEKQRGQMEELDQYLARMRMQGEEQGDLPASEETRDESDSEVSVASPDSDTEQVARESVEEKDSSKVAHPLLSSITKSRKEKGKEHAASINEQPDDITTQISLERRRAQRAELKHHGKKSTLGKVGKSTLKTSSGSKKKNDKFVVGDASVF